MNTTLRLLNVIALAGLIAAMPGCERKPHFSMIIDGGTGSSGDWWTSYGSLFLESDKPGVIFGMKKAPGGNREFSYVVLFRHEGTNRGANRSTSRVANATVDGPNASIRDDFSIDGHAVNLVAELKGDVITGKMQTSRLALDGKDFDPTKGIVFLVDLTPAGRPVKQLDVALLANPSQTAEGAKAKSLAAQITAQVERASAEARAFLRE